MNPTYVRYELLRLVRNVRFSVFSLVFPLVLFLTIAGANRHQTLPVGPYRLSFPLYFMVSMAGYGAMIAAIAGGGRIATERSSGWNRQLRLTPLRPRTYLSVKVLTAYALAVVSIAVLYAAGVALGVSVPAGRWAEMTALLLLGIAPFVALGIVAGHLLSPDSLGPAIGGGTAFFAFLGGQWYPPPDSGVLHYVGEAVPSYWLTQASHVGIGGDAWGALGWTVVALWTAGAAALAGWAYRRDTRRV